MRRRILLILWLLTDYLLFLAAYALAYVLRVGMILSTDLPFGHFMGTVAVSGVVWLSALLMTRTFSINRNQRDPITLAYICYAAVVGVAMIALTHFFLYQQVFSRMLILYGAILTIALTCLSHAFFGFLMRVILRRDPPEFPTLVVGVTRESRHLLKTLRERRSALMPVAILDTVGVKEKEIEGVPVLGRLNKFEETLKDKHITHLIQCSDLEQSINMLSACRERGITYMLLPSVVGIVERDERVESLEGKAVMVVSPDRGWLSGLFV